MFAFIRRMFIFGLMLVGGIVMLIGTIRSKAEWDKPHGDLETITEDELYTGRIVEGEIYDLWEEFAYTEEYDTTLGVQTSKSRTTYRYFALPLEYSFYEKEDPVFIAVSTKDSGEISNFKKIEKETIDFYYNGIEYDDYTTVHFVGRVKKLNNEYLGFFKEYIANIYGVSETEAKQYYAPYVLVSYTYNEGAEVFVMVLAAVFAVVGLIGLVFFIARKVLTGR